jgi:hypothetical protein
MPMVRVKRNIGKRFRRGDTWNLPIGTLKHCSMNELGDQDRWGELFEVKGNGVAIRGLPSGKLEER